MNDDAKPREITDAEFEELLALWSGDLPVDPTEGMVTTSLDEWESEQYEAWCVEQERRARGEAA